MVIWHDPPTFSGIDVNGLFKADANIFTHDNTFIDAQVITRLQYNVKGATHAAWINVYMEAEVTSGEWNSSHNVIIPYIAIAPASDQELQSGAVPSSLGSVINRPGVIFAGPTELSDWKSMSSGSTGSGWLRRGKFRAPSAESLRPGTKYWIVAFFGDYKSTKQSDYWPPTKAIKYLNNWRGSSFWTNRKPRTPTIVQPQHGASIVTETFDLEVSTSDPDELIASSTPRQRDLAGIEVQYSEQPTSDNPNPAWRTLPVPTTYNGVLQSWHIEGEDPNSGGVDLWNGAASGTPMPVQVGWKEGDPTPFLTGQTIRRLTVPEGDIRLRVRAFDWGHSSAITRPIRNDPNVHYNPETYPAFNKSEWSEPVNLYIPQTVPPPILTYPVGSQAVPVELGSTDPEGTVTPSWVYRNIADPPNPQAFFEIRMRPAVGNHAWSSSGLVAYNPQTPYTWDSFASYELYEWQVRTVDDKANESPWSAKEFFWTVPVPATGETLPLPTDTIEGAALGCGTHRVFVYRRGGTTRVGEITHLAQVEWERMRDDISNARITVADWDIDCGNLLAKLQTWAYEIAIYRDNGFSVDKVWEGPITALTYHHDKVVIAAKDVMVHAYRRILKQAMNDTRFGDSVTSRAARIIQNAYAPDDPNVLQYLQVIRTPDDANQRRSTPAYSRTAFEELDDMAANAGLDYTVVGRSIIVWSGKFRIGLLPEFRDVDLGAPPIVSEYGLSFANYYAVSDGFGVWGAADRLDEFGRDDVYGLVELLSSTWATESAEERGIVTQEQLAKLKESFEQMSETSIKDRYPPPVVVRVPDNTTLNPNTIVSIQHLVPGVAIPLRSTSTLREVRGMQKLDSIKVVEEKGEETISITMSPFNRDDAALEGEEFEE